MSAKEVQSEVWIKDPTSPAAPPAPSDIDATLNERGKRYGSFVGHAAITQDLKASMRRTKGWDRLSETQTEALEMIAHKIGRILNGDPDYDDSWRDIAGYSELIVKELNGDIR
jgi:hypothetical protein